MNYLTGCILGLLAVAPLLWIVRDQQARIRALNRRVALLEEAIALRDADAKMRSEWNRQLSHEIGKRDAEIATLQAGAARGAPVRFGWTLDKRTWEN